MSTTNTAPVFPDEGEATGTHFSEWPAASLDPSDFDCDSNLGPRDPSRPLATVGTPPEFPAE